MTTNTIYQQLGGELPDKQRAVALLAPERNDVGYADLLQHISSTVQALNQMGIGRNDRVAVILPNGPDMASAFVSIASGATCAPLNPNYRAKEYAFYLSDLNAKALVILDGMVTEAVDVATQLRIPVIRLVPQSGAGIFKLIAPVGHKASAPAASGLAEPEDIALVLHTSGTTSRPKIVPLSHKNVCASAKNIRTTLRLTPDDRCMNIMPLFHIHGLMAAVMGSLTSGASLVCTPGYLAPRFYDWLDHYKPTWYTAVPTMHQGILGRVEANRDIIKRSNLRFIRSSSASLPPQVLEALEQTFGAPVIEAYGMTEASHQMACNPLPPLEHKAGTVGPAAGPQVAIMDVAGNLLESGEIGEIVIQGENVTAGYENNPEANAKAFTNGWFRTGDQGVIDADGYVTITGRLKEIINRGGEKISPREVDEVLLNHPAVVQSLAFAVPHPHLGEDIVAAVVLNGGKRPTELEVRQFAAESLADFKVPAQIIFMDEIPKGPTGKLQRIGLAERLGIEPVLPNLEAIADWTAPRNELETFLAEIWADVLVLKAADGRPAVGVHARFLELGGDSITAMQIVSRIRHAFEIEFSLIEMFDLPTIAEQAELVEKYILISDLSM